MLLNILDLEEVSVDDIMVPRSEVYGIDLDDSDDEILRAIQTSSHTRLPVWKEDINNVVGMLHMRNISRVIDSLLSPQTLIVVSSDLSHFLDYGSCQRRDRATSALIEDMQADRIGPYDACGAFPVRGLLMSARRHGWHARTLDMRNSGDATGDRSRVVGYGAYEFY